MFSLALFGVFAVTSLLVVVIGARVYASTVEQMNDNYSARTGLSYLSEKVRQNDVQGAVSVDLIEGQTALVLEQSLGTELYRTWIYLDEGSIKELFIRADGEAKLSGGQPVLEAEGFDAAWDGDLLRLTMMENGRAEELLLRPRCA